MPPDPPSGAVVQVVFDQEDEVTAFTLCRGIQRIAADGESPVQVIMAVDANGTGIGLDQQVGVTVGASGIDQSAVLAVVHGMATVAMSDASVVESHGGVGHEAQANGDEESLLHSDTSGKRC